MPNTTRTIGKMISTINPERYGELLSQYQPRIVKTEVENERFLAIVEDLMHRPELTPEEDALLELLVKLIEAFEAEHYAIEASTPRSRLLHLMDARSLIPTDLVDVLGSVEEVNAIIEGHSEIDRVQAQKLSKLFGIDFTLFFPN